MSAKRPRADSTASSADERGARERLLAAAFDLFHEKGVSGTSVDEILARSATGKSQLYHYFGSKDGLLTAVIEDFAARLAAGELPGCQPLRDVDDLEAWFESFVAFQRATGASRFCPMATIASGLSADQEPIRQLVVSIFDRARDGLLAFFSEQARAGRLPAGESPQALTDFCTTVMQGGLLVSRVRRDPQPFEHAVAHALRHVRALLDA